MKPYGVDRKDHGCCPGHDKFPPDSYSSNRSKRAKARDTKYAHSRERTRFRIFLQACLGGRKEW